MQRQITNRLSEMILAGQVGEDDTVEIGLENDAIVMKKK